MRPRNAGSATARSRRFAKVPEKLPEIKPDQLKPASQFRLIGKDVPRLDVVDKSSGKPIYAMDVQVPGMVYGTLARAPVRGSGPTSFNRDELKKQPGIIEVVALDNGVGIIGNTVEAVFAARAQAQGANGKTRRARRSIPTANLHEYLAHVRDPARKGVVGRTSRRRQCRDRGRGEGSRQRVHQRLRLPRADGAACLRRLRHA